MPGGSRASARGEGFQAEAPLTALRGFFTDVRNLATSHPPLSRVLIVTELTGAMKPRTQAVGPMQDVRSTSVVHAVEHGAWAVGFKTP